MKWVIQRVKNAHVTVNEEVVGNINHGLLILMGVTHNDTWEDAQWLIKKTLSMRIFSDEDGKMNLSLQDVGGQILCISQFTLHALTAKGNRPSFIEAAKPEIAQSLYEKVVEEFKVALPDSVASGVFGADMHIYPHLDGPVTLIIDSKHRL